MIVTPFQYFGNRGHALENLLKVILDANKRNFAVFYDPFCGSGSYTLTAIQLHMAKEYVMSDTYAPIIKAWKILQEKPEQLIDYYSKYLNELFLKNSSKERENYYQLIKSYFNQLPLNHEERGLLFPFLIHFAKNYVPIIKNGYFDSPLGQCELDQPIAHDISIETFSQRVREVNLLLQNIHIQIHEKNFTDALTPVAQKDIVLMDMPYPDLPDETIYHRPENKKAFHKKAINTLEKLAEKKAVVLAFYGAGELESSYLFNDPQLQHYLRLNHQDNKLFSVYLDHVYLSSYLSINLPKNMIAYKAIRDRPYKEQLSYLETQVNQRSLPQIALQQIQSLSVLNSFFKPFHQIFEQYALTTGEKTCLVDPDDHIFTYQSINLRANYLAHYLLHQGVQKGHVVAICLKSRLEFIISLIAVLKTGAAYVPISTAQPENVVSETLDDCQPQFCITQNSDKHAIPSLWQKVTFVINFAELSHLQNAQEHNPESSAQVLLDDLAYIMYTSGSTGRPKGAAILHRGLPYCLKSHQTMLEFTAQDTMLQMAKMGFDASLMEIVLALGSGATLYLLPSSVENDEELFKSYLKVKKISTIIIVPSKIKTLVNPDNYPDLRALVVVGESFTADLVKPWLLRPHNNPRIILNGYGLTETTICTTLGRYQTGELLTIGEPIIGTQLYLLDDNQQEIKEVGIKGELYVGGESLAQCYWRNAEQTKERFIEVKLTHSAVKVRLYRTGDLAERASNKPMEYILLGRVDNQIKLRGQRLEPEHVEAKLWSLPIIQENMEDLCVVGVKQFTSTRQEKQHLVTYLVAKKNCLNAEQLTSYWISEELKKRLPNFMVPNAIEYIDILPKTINGKINRKLLANTEKYPIPFIRCTKRELPITEAEIVLADIWKRILNMPPDEAIYRDDEFFYLGGSSIDFSSLRADLKNHFSLFPYAAHLKDNSLLLCNSLKAMARWISHGTPLQLIKEGHSQHIPLYLIHSLVGDGNTEYANLTTALLALDENQPIYGIQARGLQLKNKEDAKALDPSIEAIAVDYIQALFNLGRTQHNQPYFLVGWSSGGVIAFEMAQQLVTKGYQVKLYLIDCINPSYFNQLTPAYRHNELIELINILMAKLGIKKIIQWELVKKEQYLEQLEEILNQLEKDVLEQTHSANVWNQWVSAKQIILAELSYNQDKAILPKLDSQLFIADKTLQQLVSYHIEAANTLGWPKQKTMTIQNTTHFTLLENSAISTQIAQDLEDARLERYVEELKHALQRDYSTRILKQLFSSKDSTITATKEPHTNAQYVPVILSEKIEVSKRTPNTLAERMGSSLQKGTHEEEIRIEDLFLSSPNRKRATTKIWIQGALGSGKSALINSCLYRTTKEKLWENEFEAVISISALDILAYARYIDALPDYLQRQEPTSLGRLVCFIYMSADNQQALVIDKWLRSCHSNERRVLFTIDGYDELAQYRKSHNQHELIEQLIQKILSYPYLLITSRFGWDKDEVTADFRIINNLGFQEIMESTEYESALDLISSLKESYASEQNKCVIQYINKFFISRPRYAENLLLFIEKNKNVQAILSLPINLELLCSIWEELVENKLDDNEKNITLTYLYTKIVEDLFQRFFKEKQDVFDERESLKNAIRECIELAAFYSINPENSSIWKKSYAEINKQDEEDINNLISTIGASKAKRNLARMRSLEYAKIKHFDWFKWVVATGFIKLKTTGFSEILWENNYEFLHSTFQEYFIACYLRRLMDEERENEVIAFIRKNKYNFAHSYSLLFLAGLLAEEETPDLLNKYYGWLLDEPQDCLDRGNIFLYIACIEEAREVADVPNQAKMIDWLEQSVYLELICGTHIENLIDLLKRSPFYLEKSKLLNKLVDALNNTTDAEIRKKVTFILSKLRLKSKKIIDLLLPLLSQPNDEVQISTFEAVSNLGLQDDERFIDAIRGCSQNERVTNAMKKYMAKLDLQKQPKKEPIASSILFDEINDCDWRVRQESIYKVEELGIKEKYSFLDVILSRLSDPVEAVQLAAAHVLSYFLIQKNQIAETLLTRLKEECSTFLKVKILYALGHLGIRDPENIDCMLRYLNDQSIDVRRAAVLGLNRLQFFDKKMIIALLDNSIEQDAVIFVKILLKLFSQEIGNHPELDLSSVMSFLKRKNLYSSFFRQEILIYIVPQKQELLYQIIKRHVDQFRRNLIEQLIKKPLDQNYIHAFLDLIEDNNESEKFRSSLIKLLFNVELADESILARLINFYRRNEGEKSPIAGTIEKLLCHHLLIFTGSQGALVYERIKLIDAGFYKHLIAKLQQVALIKVCSWSNQRMIDAVFFTRLLEVLEETTVIYMEEKYVQIHSVRLNIQISTVPPRSSLTHEQAKEIINNIRIKKLINKLSLLSNLGQIKQALIYCNEIIRIDPQNVDALVQEAITLIQAKSSDAAMECFNKALEYNLKKIEEYHQKGIKRETLPGENAGEMYKEMEDAQQKQARIYYFKIVTLYNKKKYAEALLCCTEAKKYNNKSVPILLIEANSLVKERKFSSALANYNHVLTIDPKNCTTYANKADLLVKLGQFEEASTCFKQMFSVSKLSAYGYCRYATFKSILGDHKEALANCTKALELEPCTADLFFTCALIRTDAGEYEKAVDDISEALRLEPDNQYYIHIKAYILALLGQYQYIGNKADDADILNCQGLVHHYQKNYKAAAEFFEAGLELEPFNEYICANYANVLIQLGNYKEAIQFANRALEVNLQYAFALCVKGLALFLLGGKADEAMNYFEEVLKVNPKNILALTYKGYVCARQGDIQGGMRLIDDALAINSRHYQARLYQQMLLKAQAGSQLLSPREFSIFASTTSMSQSTITPVNETGYSNQ